MKNRFQRGQALLEYLISLTGIVMLTISGLRIFHAALENQWDTLSFWLCFPNP